MSKDTEYKDYDQLNNFLKLSVSDVDFDLLDKAYQFAKKAHLGQKRHSGVDYILHPVSVAYILAELGMDSPTIAAALLHDVVEDCDVSFDMLKREFGSEIATLIDGVTRISRIPYSTREQQQAENIRKMLFAMAEDIRVIIIKLADRLNNLRTIGCMTEQKRRDKALETMEIYAPIAHRLGIRAIKEELEDLSLGQLDPIAYDEIEQALDMKKHEREDFIDRIKQKLKAKIEPVIGQIQVEGRVKSIKGIYDKMFVKNYLMDEIYDIYAVRVIVDNINDCYNVLGIIHDMFQPIPNRFKDYISIPKKNMYQALHSTVIGKDGLPFEIQIRSWEMHRTAEYGIAAHWKYKTSVDDKNQSMQERLSWIRNILENQSENGDARDLVKTIKSDLVPEEVFVLTPLGEVINLPTGATVIDFAYAIHSGVGNRMVGAKVDKRIVPIEYEVKTGQIVEILTTKDVTNGPKRDWLNIVTTSEARNKIRQWFKREKREENIEVGKLIFDRELKRAGVVIPAIEQKEFLEAVSSRHKYNTVDHLYETIGYGGVQIQHVMVHIKEEYQKSAKPSDVQDFAPEAREGFTMRHAPHSSVEIDGVSNCRVNFARCCGPIPGDEIIGFITRGKGVSVHKRGCINVPVDIEICDEPHRWVEVRWVGSGSGSFLCTVNISTSGSDGMLAEITEKLSLMHVQVHSLNFDHVSGGDAVINATIKVKNSEHLATVISKLSRVSGVSCVKRI